MPESAPGEPPSRWTVINDYSKTVVTLGAALLGFIAAFIDRLQIAEASSVTRMILVAALVFLLFAVAFALAVQGRMDRYLRICSAGDPAGSVPGTATPLQWQTERPRAVWWCKLCANLSYLALFLAAIALASFTIARLWSNPVRNEAAALTEATNLLASFSRVAQPKWQVEALTFDPRTDTFEVIVLEQTTSARFKVTMPRNRLPSAIQRLP
jgi:hypothetical protein